MIGILAIKTALGCIFNRIRGGGHGVLRRKIERLVGIEHDQDGSVVGKMRWYQHIVNRILDGDTINAVAFFFFVALFLGHGYEVAAYAAAAMFAGAAPGWGKYIGALGGWETSDLVEWHPIDKIIEDYKDRPKLWGFLGLTLRGALWGFLLSLALHSVFPLIAGALMGCAYYITLKIGGQKTGWPYGEILFGGILWISC